MSEDVEINGISGSSIVRIKLKTLIIAIITIFTFVGTVAGWIINDYTSKISKIDYNYENLNKAVQEINLNVYYIRGQMEEIARPPKTNQNNSSPTSIHPPEN
jgi:peptidoglycan hydrolase CwlO-like protein